jgi:hypothetical protein
VIKYYFSKSSKLIFIEKYIKLYYMKTNKKYILFLAILAFILMIIIFNWTNYLFINGYIKSSSKKENFTSGSSHTVDLPLTTTYSCTNFCGPAARCAITGQQCLADIDCPGCQPNTPPQLQNKQVNIPGDNDAGKLTLGVTPQYSTLTTDIGTQARIITHDKFAKPSQANFGVDVWTSSFIESEKLFNSRFKPPNSVQFMPNYPKRYSLSGDYYDDGPLASNSYLN